MQKPSGVPTEVPAVGHAPNAPETGYDPVHFARLAEIEERHFWFTARRRLIQSLVAGLAEPLPAGYRVLEVGCGTGNVLSALQQACRRGKVFGMDRFLEGLLFAGRRGCPRLLQGDAHQPPFGEPFDIIGAFDVIEHLREDERVLSDLHSMLSPRGHLVVTVPAHQWLWSDFDDLSHHQRRYSHAELERKLRRAGFARVFVSPFMMSILPLVWLHRKLPAGASRREGNVIQAETRIVPVLNGVLGAVLSMEGRAVERGWRLPFGSSLVAVASRA